MPSKRKAESRTRYIISGILLIIFGGPILGVVLHGLLNVVLGNPVVNTTGRATVNIATLLAWPFCLLLGLYLAIFAGRKK